MQLGCFECLGWVGVGVPPFFACRFCGLAPDRVEHYFGVDQDPCPVIAEASAHALQRPPPSLREWFGITPCDTRQEHLRIAQLRYSLRKALQILPPCAGVGPDWLRNWFVSSRPLAVGAPRLALSKAPAQSDVVPKALSLRSKSLPQPPPAQLISVPAAPVAVAPVVGQAGPVPVAPVVGQAGQTWS